MLTSVPHPVMPLEQKADKALKKRIVKYVLIGLLSIPLFLPASFLSGLVHAVTHFSFHIHWFIKLYLAINMVVLGFFLLVYLNSYRQQRKSSKANEQQSNEPDVVVNEEEIAAAFDRTIFPNKSIVLINGQLYDLGNNYAEQMVKDIKSEPVKKISNQ